MMVGSIKGFRGTTEERFWAKVNKNGQTMQDMETNCWEWTASCKSKGGGGHINIGGKIVSANRFSYELANGEIPPGARIFHHCTNKKCVRPDHLFLGVRGAEGTKAIPVIYKDGQMHKRCKRCQDFLPYTNDNFHSIGNGKGLRSYCKKCTKYYQRISHKTRWYAHLHRNAKVSSSARGIEFEMTKQDIKDLFDKQNGICYWLGIPLEPSEKPKSLYQPSLDRLDRTKGYTLDNVVLCTFMANFGRNENDTQSFVEFLNILPDHLQNALWKKDFCDEYNSQ